MLNSGTFLAQDFITHEVGQVEKLDIFPAGCKCCSMTSSLRSVGQAVRPTAALFNHSCDPNIVRVDSGKVMVGVAGREITAGEEVCDNYGRHYTQTIRDGRQQFLRER